MTKNINDFKGAITVHVHNDGDSKRLAFELSSVKDENQYLRRRMCELETAADRKSEEIGRLRTVLRSIALLDGSFSQA